METVRNAHDEIFLDISVKKLGEHKDGARLTYTVEIPGD